MGVSIKDISKDTGLSIVTISKYLNGKKILDKNRIRIEESISRLNYTPNINARILRDAVTNIVAVIVPSIETHFWGEYLTYMEIELRKLGYLSMVIFHDYEKDSRKSLIEYMDYNFAGAVVLPKDDSDTTASLFMERGIPVVTIDKVMKNTHIDCVTSANYDAGYNLAEYLITKGHQMIGCVRPKYHIDTLINRYEGFMNAIERYGMTAVSGRNVHEIMEKSGSLVTSVVAFSNGASLDAFEELCDLGFLVGINISFMAIDDDELFTSLDPSVTVYSQNKGKIVSTAVLLLQDLIRDRSMKNHDGITVIPMSLIERQSVVDLSVRDL